MEKVLAAGGFPLAPLPAVLVSCGTVEQPLALTVAWTGIVSSQPLRVYISVQPVRHSFPAIRDSGEFVINLVGEGLLGALDYCGTHSGREVDKFAACSLTARAASQISAPLIAESPLSIECRVCRRLPMGSHEMFIADVAAVQADPALLDENGRLCFERLAPVGYANSRYFALGEMLGSFGCSRDLIR